MVVKIELVIEVETQVAQDGFRGNNGVSYKGKIDG